MSDELKDLKSKAYDLLAALEFYNKELSALNQKISELSQVKPIEEKKD